MGRPVPPSRLFLIGLALLLLFVAFVVVRPYLGAVVLAILIGFLMQPIHRRLVRWVRYPSLAATIGLLLVILALVLPFVVMVQQLRDEAAMVVAFVQDEQGLERAMGDIAARFGMERSQVDGLVQRALTGLAGAVQGGLGSTVAKVFDVVAGFIVFLFLVFFVLRDGEAFARGVKDLTPIREGARDRLYHLIAQRTRAIALGTFLVSLAQGIAAGIGWWIFGFPAPIFWGFVMTVIAVLPLGAPMLVMVPAGIIRIVQGDLLAGIGIIAYGAVVVGLLDNLLRPFVVGRSGGGESSDAHPAIILVGTIGGLAVFGVSGFLLGPLLLSLLGPVLEVWAEERRGEHAAQIRL